MAIPNICPACGASGTDWIVVEDVKTKQGFSIGKALLGGVVFGPLGLMGGALGKSKKYESRYCKKCNFQHTYTK
jgi:hypothetical protein